MELQQLRYVVAVADERSFTRAAHRCHVVQSALSHQIAALERELGVRLFARTSRRVQITAAGEAFVAAARTSLDAAERAVVDAAAATGRIRGTLTIGAIPTLTAVDVPAALGELRATHPDVHVRLRTGGSDEFVAAIVAGTLDVAVLGVPESTTLAAGIGSRVLARERLVAAVSPRHRLAGRRRLRMQDFADETFVDFSAGSPGRVQSDRAFAVAGVRRDVAFESSSLDMLLRLVHHDLAIALLPPDAVPTGDDLVRIPVVAGPTRVVRLAWSGLDASPATRALLAVVERSLPRVG